MIVDLQRRRPRAELRETGQTLLVITTGGLVHSGEPTMVLSSTLWVPPPVLHVHHAMTEAPTIPALPSSSRRSPRLVDRYQRSKHFQTIRHRCGGTNPRTDVGITGDCMENTRRGKPHQWQNPLEALINIVKLSR